MKEGVQQIQIRIPVLVHQSLKAKAASLDRSVNWLINRLLSEALAKNEAQQ